MNDPIAVPEKMSLTGRIALWTAFLVALAGLIDAIAAVSTKTESLTCTFGISLPWCGSRSEGRTFADFSGLWINNNSEPGITRVQIYQRLDKAIVHAWGKCHPTDCDWGDAETPASEANSGSLRVEWNSGFSISKATLTIGQNNRLEVRTNVHFTDTSGRPDFEAVDYLQRQ